MKLDIHADSRSAANCPDETIVEYDQTVARIRPPLAGSFARGLRADVPIVVSGQL